MFDYPLLEVLLAVEREGSFERTAQTQGVSKSAISQSLRLLEERMGAVTIARNSTQVTQFGGMLCRHLERVRLFEQKFLSENAHIFKLEDQPPVTVKVVVGDDSLSSWFVDVVSSAHKSQDSVLFDVVIDNEHQILNELKRGQVLAALTTNGETAVGYTSHFLGHHAFRATASPRFVQHNFPNGVTSDALKEAPSLRYSPQDTNRDRWARQLLGENIEFPTITLPSSHGIVNACINGTAWAMNSSLLVDRHIASGELVELVPNQAFIQELHWHVCRFATDTMCRITDHVLCAAQQHLIQSPPLEELAV